MRTIIFTILCFFGTIIIYGQENDELICTTDFVMKDYYDKHPEDKLKDEQFNMQLAQWMQDGTLKEKLNFKKSGEFYIIPIVVHVVSDGSPLGSINNRTDQEIIDWVNYTNEVLEATATGMMDDTNGGAAFPVKLALAKIDPNCNPTNGIDRIDASGNAQYVQYGVNSTSGHDGVHEDVILAMSKWDTSKYYNIYVVNKLYSNTTAANGYAYYPGGSKDHSFMIGNIAAVGQQTMPHEFGHALGLRHTHEGYVAGSGTLVKDENGNYVRDENGDYVINVTKPATCPPNTNCSIQGDLVCDTSPSFSLYDSSINIYRCISDKINSCTGQLYDGVEKNIMAYTYCFRDRFTPGQRDRAIAQMINYRSGLLNSPVANETPINNAVTLPNTCIPAGTSSTSNFNIGITSVRFGDIYNDSPNFLLANNNYYTDYTGDYCLGVTTTHIPNNAPTTLYVKTGTSATNKHSIKAYLDYNNDGQFDETNEVILNMSNVTANSTVSLDITPPSTANVYNIPLRLRVIGDYNGTAITACGNLRYGEAEDYSVIIDNATLSTNSAQKSIVDIYNHNNTIYIKSDIDIKTVNINDMSGKQMVNSKVNNKQFSKEITAKNQIVIVVVELTNGQKISKKLRL